MMQQNAQDQSPPASIIEHLLEIGKRLLILRHLTFLYTEVVTTAEQH